MQMPELMGVSVLRSTGQYERQRSANRAMQLAQHQRGDFQVNHIEFRNYHLANVWRLAGGGRMKKLAVVRV